MPQTTNRTNLPLISFGVSGLSVSLWENEADNADGSTRTYKSVSVRRTFFNHREKQTDTQTITLSPTEVSCLGSLLLKMADALVAERRRDEPDDSDDRAPF